MTPPITELKSSMPTVSVILPVLHESAGINDMIARVRAQTNGERIEIIVVDGDPQGSTINAIADTAVIKITSERGRASQMNRGAALARGNILLFLHADTLLPSNVFSLIREAMNNRAYIAGAFDLGFATNRTIFRVTEKYVYFRTRLTRVPFGDQAIFIRREYFENIGRFKEIPIMEDVELMKRIRKSGGKVIIIPEKVLTSTRRYEREGVVYCTLRNWIIQIFHALGVPPERLAKWY